MKKKIEKVIEKIAIVISTVTLFWMLSSYVEVATTNLTENPTYSDINFFQMLVENADE